MARILVIDDDPAVQAIIAEMLESAGHVAVLARFDGTLWAMLRQSFDLVLTDLLMPDVDGWRVAEWLQLHRPTVPVIAFSGDVSTSTMHASGSLFTATLEKPIEEALLLETVAAALRAHTSWRQAPAFRQR